MDIGTKILSDVTVFSKYAKYIPSKARRETWEEIVYRDIEMMVNKFPNLKEEIYEAFGYVINKEVVSSMRMMQFAGKPIEINPARGYNCSALAIDHYKAFAEVMFLLLGGSGVGISVQKNHVEKLPQIRTPLKKKRFLVGDSIEGWAEAVNALITAYMNNKAKPEFDFRDIRHKGAKLITAGGKAPGPQPLKDCLFNIEKVFNIAIEERGDGASLKTIEVHDICCFIADAVLAGGIRRAAILSMFTYGDEDMLSAKFGNWWEQHPQRGRANNSVMLLRNRITKEDFDFVWEKIKASGSGEPGIVFTNNENILVNPCVTGDTLIEVMDHGALDNGELISSGITYKIPMKMLVDLYNTSTMPPLIISYNTETGERGYDYMDDAALTRENTNIIELEFDDGIKIKCTPDHKIYTENRGYVNAKDLSSDDIIIYS